MPRRGPAPTVSPGDRYGRLVVIAESGKSGRNRAYLCRCDCGNQAVVRGAYMRDGRTTSCGCAAPIKRTHGLSGHPLYPAWVQMHARCEKPTNLYWHRYGGRGIHVCARWSGREGFANFLADMGDRPEDTTLDRVDNDGDYEPSNCRWATPLEQSRNRGRGL